MEATQTAKPEELSLKILQSHLIKTVVGALAVALVGAFLTSYVSSYTTKDNIDELNKDKVETHNDIKTLKADINEIKISLSNTGIYTNTNKDDIKTLKDDVREIKNNQDELLKVMYAIQAKQK